MGHSLPIPYFIALDTVIYYLIALASLSDLQAKAVRPLPGREPRADPTRAPPRANTMFCLHPAAPGPARMRLGCRGHGRTPETPHGPLQGRAGLRCAARRSPLARAARGAPGRSAPGSPSEPQRRSCPSAHPAPHAPPV
uniref:Uncharacterized protein n=1 Tax=Gopherus agassizii TaxID=38772 RepID=A0A452IWC1_9SAUR